MDRRSPDPTDELVVVDGSTRTTDRVLSVLASAGALRTREITSALGGDPASRVRQALARLKRAGRVHSPAYGVWAISETPGNPGVAEVDRIVFTAHGSTASDIRRWADNLCTLNPVAPGVEPFLPATEWVIVGTPDRGVTLALMQGKRMLATMVAYGDIEEPGDESPAQAE